MFKVFYLLLLNFFIFNFAYSKDISIGENLNLEFTCELEKKIVKNLDSFQIYSNKPSTLMVNGLSKFFSQNSNFDVKIVNKDVVLFKAFNNDKTYSESAIITRKSGELIHEITKNINTDNSEKDISIYICKNKSKNA